jgi:glycosyltransferase involved in cell wall biosynthesis
MSGTPVSVLIPTKDEERNLPSTLDALGWADEIVVFDSYSSDGTLALARQRGCTVVQREFDNFSDHKNWALDHIPFHNAWVLILDADEKVSPELAREIGAICADVASFDGYYIPRQIWVDGVWLKHAGKYPDYQLRLFRKGRARYERRIVHEHMLVEGRIGYLANPLVHVDDKGIHRYIERHNRYAEMEAVEAFITARVGVREAALGEAGRGYVEYRRRLKNFAYRHLPFRPLLVFFYTYVLKGGFLMGRAGLKNCALRMFYEYMINLYLAELANPASPAAIKYGRYIDERCRAAASSGHAAPN